MKRFLFSLLTASLLLASISSQARQSHTTGRRVNGSNMCNFSCVEWDDAPNGAVINVTYDEWDAPCESIKGAEIFGKISFDVTTEEINGRVVAISLSIRSCEDNQQNDDFDCNITPQEMQQYLQRVNETLSEIQS